MTSSSVEEQKIWQILQEVKDPEIPVLSIVDLGIVRSVHYLPSNSGEPGVSKRDGRGEVTITPTYSGCPAMDVIRMDIRLKLLEHGYKNITVQQSLSPAWTTDWITEEGKRKLKEFGIAPPNPKQQFCTSEMFKEEAVQCPFCNSYHTKQVSRFGSTACKAVYHCDNCKENFDYFKCH
ncbi:phenylacetate-CoA oxygenase subunit PaaJ [Chitinophagaceae bacterium LB-8]|uniref:Phenylacetate-CoA oxygenase subunit PaaJ n=1 Tax=Paraflavisolibacter caeni TaxID=2982496 RepID=A0A9X3BKB0_9BACT|nr:1,2-phenylacetyl-CoA epoxidase subunit PaaD [Paraflavisolibacter caeni]MCU7552608.1 phenylacetate-CoA oxygenase subunit PaaJ [Paraflavisolibacter caeni]